MKIAQIKQWQHKVYEYAEKEDNYAQKIAVECQKYCDFEIKFAQNDPSDGLVLCYDNDMFENMHLSVDKFILLYESLKRKLTLEDVKYNY